MTLEQLVMYLWRDMPLIGWACIVAAASACAGIAIFLEGRFIMRASTTHTRMQSATAEGGVVETESYSVSTGYGYGQKMARNGLWIMLTSFAAFIGFIQLW